MLTAYLNTLKTKGGFTTETISKLSGVPEGTVKNILSGKTEDPRLENVAAIIKAMGGSLDGIYQSITDDNIEANSVITIKEAYENRLKEQKEHYEQRINDLKVHKEHYENRLKEQKEHYEQRLADKREHIQTILLDKRWFRIALVITTSALIAMVILTTALIAMIIANNSIPSLGW